MSTNIISYQEETIVETEMKYKQYFYNFFLLTFHDVMNYFKKGVPHSPQSTRAESNGLDQNYQTPRQKQHSSSSAQKKLILDSDQGAIPILNQLHSENMFPFMQLDYAYFETEQYIKSFGTQDQAFFAKVSQTKQFEDFVKRCFRSVDFRSEYIQERKESEIDYTFHHMFQYVEDCRMLAKRQQGQTLNDKIEEIEFKQNQIINQALSGDLIPEFHENISYYLGQQLLNGKIIQGRHFQDFKSTSRTEKSTNNTYTQIISPKTDNISTKQLKQMETHNQDKSIAQSLEYNKPRLIDYQTQNDSQWTSNINIQSLKLLNQQTSQRIDASKVQQIESNSQPGLYQCLLSQIVCEVNNKDTDKIGQLDCEELLAVIKPVFLQDCDCLSSTSNSCEDLNISQKRQPKSLLIIHNQLKLQSRFSEDQLLNYNNIPPTDSILFPINNQLIAGEKMTSEIVILQDENNNTEKIIHNNKFNSGCNIFSPDGFMMDDTIADSNEILESVNNTTPQINKRFFDILNLDSTCRNLWGYYQDDGNFNLN